VSANVTADAIREYHAILGRPGLAADSQGVLDGLQRERGLTYGPRPICTVLRPRFLTLCQFRALRDAVAGVLPAFDTIYARALADRDFRRQFRLLDWEERLLDTDPGFACPSPTARLDSFLTADGGLQFTEYNTETPAGGAYADALTKVFYALPAFREFQRTRYAFPLPCKPGVTDALLDAYAQWRGTRNDPPRVAILDWREVPTFSEFVLFYDHFRGLGIEARIVDPREVEYIDGKLMAGDYHITLVYKRVLLTELIERGSIDHPVVQAVRDGAVCMVNSFRCKILFKKASLAVVSDERNASLFTPKQAELIRRHIPWTRVVEERKTQFDGASIDLVPFTHANKDRLVLKPNDDYGGRGIVLGWAVDQPTWDAAVQNALSLPFVVQQKIDLPREPFPKFIDDDLQFLDHLVDTNPYVIHGTTVQGCLTRISAGDLVNVSAGSGATVPTFLIED
jgi:uncharacterized circularly permuted ATP-grasp superfamily protein